MNIFTLRPDTVTHTELEFHLIYFINLICFISGARRVCGRLAHVGACDADAGEKQPNNTSKHPIKHL